MASLFPFLREHHGSKQGPPVVLGEPMDALSPLAQLHSGASKEDRKDQIVSRVDKTSTSFDEFIVRLINDLGNTNVGDIPQKVKNDKELAAVMAAYREKGIVLGYKGKKLVSFCKQVGDFEFIGDVDGIRLNAPGLSYRIKMAFDGTFLYDENTPLKRGAKIESVYNSRDDRRESLHFNNEDDSLHFILTFEKNGTYRVRCKGPAPEGIPVIDQALIDYEENRVALSSKTTQIEKDLLRDLGKFLSPGFVEQMQRQFQPLPG